jgi:REP element-mobilizing transposase RayT
VRRPEREARHPLHLTTRIRAGLPSLREAKGHRLLLRTLSAGADRFGFRLIEYSVQTNHLHMLIEVPDQHSLTRGAKGILVRLAKQLNKLWGRKGNVFPERYHVRELETPAEVRRALVYVLHNARRHGCWGRGIDPFSSGPWFSGYRSGGEATPIADAATRANARSRVLLVTLLGVPGADELRRWPRTTCRACSWLLHSGWKRHGLLDPEEGPESWARKARAAECDEPTP